jgi:hypothetical protein
VALGAWLVREEEYEMTELLPNTDRVAYEAPAIVYESELEVRAGSPLGLPDPLDLTETNK